MIFLDDSFKMIITWKIKCPKKHKKIFIPSLTLLQMSLMSEVVWRDHVFHGNSVVNFSLCISSVSGKNSWSCLIHNFRQLSQFGLLSLSTIIVLVALFQSMHVQCFCRKCLLTIFPPNQDIYLPPKIWPNGLAAGYTLFSFYKRKPTQKWIIIEFHHNFWKPCTLFWVFFHRDSFRFYFSAIYLSNMHLDGNPDTHSGCNLVVHTRC